MPDYNVVVTGTSREVYVVTADSPEHASEIWSDVEPTVSEVDNASVESVSLADD